MQLVLHQFYPAKFVPSYSAFCLKLETYLKLAKIPYRTEYSFNLSRAPKKRFPYVEIDGVAMGDSTLIMQKLSAKKAEWDLDRQLTQEQRAQAVAVQRMVEDHLAVVGMHFRFADPEGWAEFNRVVLAKAPAFLRWFIASRIHKGAIRFGKQQGIGRHSREEILAMAERDLHALSVLIGDNKYFFGDQPTSIDCSIFGVVAQCTHSKMPKVLESLGRKFPNLHDYSERMLQEFNRS